MFIHFYERFPVVSTEREARSGETSLHNRLLIVERRSLDCAALWAASLETTEAAPEEKRSQNG